MHTNKLSFIADSIILSHHLLNWNKITHDIRVWCFSKRTLGRLGISISKSFSEKKTTKFGDIPPVFRTIIWPLCAAHNSTRLKNPKKCSLFSGSEDTKIKEGLVTWDGYSFFQCCTTPNHLPHNYWTDPTLSAKTKHNKINGFQDHYSTFIGSITQPINQSMKMFNQSINQSINQPMKKSRPQLLKEWIAVSLDQSLNQSVNQSFHQVSKSANHSWSIED